MDDPTSPATSSENQRSVWRVGALATLEAAVATELFGALAHAAGVPMRVGGTNGPNVQHIVFPAFAFCTVISGLIGTALAIVLVKRSSRPASMFLWTTVVITVASLLLPALIGGATPATRVVLVVLHLAAAAIIIPQVTRRLSHRSRTDIGEVGGSRRATVDAG